MRFKHRIVWMMMKNIFILVLLATGSLFSQNGFFDAYDYSRWLSEFSMRGTIISAQGETQSADKMFNLTTSENQIKKQGNWLASVRFEGRRDFWRMIFSGSILSTEQDEHYGKDDNLLLRADAAIGIMPLWDGFYLIAGGRFYNASILVAEDSEQAYDARQWLDSFAGTQLEFRFVDWLSLRLYGDASAFSIRPLSSWNARADLFWRFGSLALTSGYYYENIDHRAGKDDPYFYKMKNQGPRIGLSYSF